MAKKAAASRSRTPARLRTITLEEHFASPAFLDGPGKKLREQPMLPGNAGRRNLVEDLLDLGEERIAAMDAAGIDMQVLSLTDPSVQQLDADASVELAREANDYLAAAVHRHPGRFAGFATLPTAAPEAAADELERMVKEHGFVGGWINGHTKGRYLDDKSFRPILERAEELRVPLCIHPTPPPVPVVEAYYAGFSPEVTFGFSRHGWGWHIETAVHVLRLILGGAFDRYPDLQIVIGHLGESLPFMMPRINRGLPKEATKLDRSMAEYLQENVYYSFSGFNFTPTFLDLFLQVGADRIMFSADYPYGSMAEARTFLDHLPISDADRHKIAHRNAERLMRV